MASYGTLVSHNIATSPPSSPIVQDFSNEDLGAIFKRFDSIPGVCTVAGGVGNHGDKKWIYVCVGVLLC